MKTNLIMPLSFLFILIFSNFQDLNSRQRSAYTVPLIGEKAPTFRAHSTNGVIYFPKDFGERWKILFSHPRNYTPVCSSEILELAYMQEEFDEMGVDIIVLSTDTLSAHINWVESLESLTYKGRKTPEIKFPLVDDNNMKISNKYGMIHYPSSSSEDVRGVFLVSPDDIIQATLFYPNHIGRNMDEIKRMVLAFQQTQKDNVFTPANWNPGDDVLLPYLNDEEKARMNEKDSDIYEVSWYMRFKKIK